MAEPPVTTLPLQRALDELDAWQVDPSPVRRRAVGEAIELLLSAFEVRGAYLSLSAPPLPELALGLGSLAGRRSARRLAALGAQHLVGTHGNLELGTCWLDADEPARHDAARALSIAFDAAWSRAEARAATRRIAALDQAVRGIAGVLSTDRVLQLIVDRVRDLSDAEYAALGILGPHGLIEAFITSGISAEDRARIGPIPRGHGILGLIVREGQSLRIADVMTHARSYGFPAHHPEMHSFLGAPVRSKGRVIGNLYLTNKRTASEFSETDQQLVEMFALHAGIAIENARLHEEVQRLAVVDERQRISQDLHDSIIQSLYALGLSLEDLPEIFADDPGEGGARVERAIDTIHSTIRDIRNLILGLRPELLENAEIDTGIHTLAAEFRLNTMIDLELLLPDELPELLPEQADQLVAMTREGLSNIARHSGATRAALELAVQDGTLSLLIGDNGKGFDPLQARTGGQHGLTNLASRAEGLGGSLTVKSEPGAGTQLVARIPLAPTGAPSMPAGRRGDLLAERVTHGA